VGLEAGTAARHLYKPVAVECNVGGELQPDNNDGLSCSQAHTSTAQLITHWQPTTVSTHRELEETPKETYQGGGIRAVPFIGPYHTLQHELPRGYDVVQERTAVRRGSHG